MKLAGDVFMLKRHRRFRNRVPWAGNMVFDSSWECALGTWISARVQLCQVCGALERLSAGTKRKKKPHRLSPSCGKDILFMVPCPTLWTHLVVCAEVFKKYLQVTVSIAEGLELVRVGEKPQTQCGRDSNATAKSKRMRFYLLSAEKIQRNTQSMNPLTLGWKRWLFIARLRLPRVVAARPWRASCVMYLSIVYISLKLPTSRQWHVIWGLRCPRIPVGPPCLKSADVSNDVTLASTQKEFNKTLFRNSSEWGVSE